MADRVRLVALLVLFLLVWAGSAFVTHSVRRHGRGPLVFRWLTGHSLDGKHRTNATWLRWSTDTLHPTSVVRWHHMPRLYRAGIRTGGTVAALVTAMGLITHRRGTLEVLATAVLIAAALAGWWLYRKLRWWRHQWQYVRPLRHRLTPILEGAPPRLAIEPGRSKAKVWLPPEFTGTDREWDQIRNAVTVTLGLEAPDVDRQLLGRNRHVTYTRSVPPPPTVAARDIRAAVEAAAEHEVVLGIGKKSQLIDVSLDSESPHLGFCMTTGDGKSTAAMNAATQVLYHGGLVVVLDYKLLSHMWARGLPNVAYAGTPAELHEMLCWLAHDDEAESELTRRKQVALASADIRGNVQADIGPRVFVVAEELNVTQKILKSHWRRLGGKGPSPAAEALDEIMFTGRQLRVHALQIGQRLSAKATSGSGSADSRENLGAIVFSNPSASTWKMLCDGHVQPPASDHKGRYQVVTRKTVREMQGALWVEEEAREFATSGVVAVPRHDMPCVTRQPVPAGVGQNATTAIEDSGQGFVLGQPVLVPSRPPNAVTLSEMVAAGLFPSKAAASKAAQRGSCGESLGEVGQAKLYDVTSVYASRMKVSR